MCEAFIFCAQVEAEGLLQAMFKDDLFICDVIDYSAFWSANDQTDLDFNIVFSDSAESGGGREMDEHQNPSTLITKDIFLV